MDDLIRRQAALDAIMGQPPEPHYPSWYAAQIEKLPAAQPATNCSEIPNSSDETISRRAAIDALDEHNMQPTIQPEPHWIPCSERLPEKAGEYLITKIRIGWNGQRYTEIAVDYFYGDYGKEYGMVWKISKKVVAWMPLPEPYKGGDK